MPSTTTNWSSADTWQRLVAAIVATGIKIDLHEVAKTYGTTYDTIQNRYRKIRAEADKLKKEVENGERDDVATPKKNKSATSTPRKPKPTKDALSTVTNGRVSKSSPKKKGTATPVKKEANGAGSNDDEDIFHSFDIGASSGDLDMDANGDEDELMF